MVIEPPEVGTILDIEGAITVGGRLIVDVEVIDTTWGEELIVVDGVAVTRGVVVTDGVVMVVSGVVMVVNGVVVVVDGVVAANVVVVVGRVGCVSETETVEVIKLDDAIEGDEEMEVVVTVGPELEAAAVAFKSA